MIKKYYLILFLYFIVHPVYAGFPEEIDSLEKRYSSAKSDEKLEIFKKLIFKYSNISITKGIIFANDAIKYGKDNADTRMEIMGLLSLAVVYYTSGKIDSSYIIISSALEYSNKIKDKFLIANGYITLSRIQLYTNLFAESFDNVQKAISICEETHDYNTLMDAKLLFGNLLFKLSDPENALEQCNDLYKTAIENRNVYYECEALNLMGSCYMMMKEYDLAIDYYYRCINLSKSKNIFFTYSNSVDNIGRYYNDVVNDYGKALNFYQSAFQISLSSGIIEINSTFATKISHIYMILNQFDSSIRYAKIALENRNASGNIILTGSSYTNLGSIYKDKGYLKESEYYLLKAWDILRDSKMLHLTQHCANRLFELYTLKKDINKALQYYEIQASLNDKIYKSEQDYQSSGIQLKYLLEKKEKNIEINRLEEKEYYNIYYYFLIVILSIFGLFFYFILHKNKKLFLSLKISNLNLEEKVKFRTKELEEEIKLNKEFSERLNESENKMRHFSENAQDLIFSLKILPEFNITYFNPVILDFTGYNATDFYNNSSLILGLIYKEDKELLLSLAFSIKKPSELITFRFKHKNGDILWAELTINQFTDESGNISELTGIVRNISERMKAEEKMRISLNLERKLDEIKSKFITASSKEMSEHLIKISKYTDILREEIINLPKEIQIKVFNYIKLINSDLDRINKIYSEQES